MVEPANPREGQNATVELHTISSLLANTPEHRLEGLSSSSPFYLLDLTSLPRELSAFPGPLKPGVTHKNDVIKFCERKITASRGRTDIADRESYILLWEMLILMLRQKGQVEGSDLADLLLRDSPEQGDHLLARQVSVKAQSFKLLTTN